MLQRPKKRLYLTPRKLLLIISCVVAWLPGQRLCFAAFKTRRKSFNKNRKASIKLGFKKGNESNCDKWHRGSD
jgi:hypothetical protein